MIKRVLVDVMQNFGPVFIVVCVLLCFSFSCPFPLYRARSKALTGLLNHSRKCVASRAKKTTSGDLDYGSQDFDFDTANAGAAKRKLSGNDLRQYEQLVIMKKYPYLDPKEFELKFGPAKNAKYRGAQIAVASDCKLTDDEPRVEVFSRGISGFAIPKAKPLQHELEDLDDGQVKKNAGENARVWNNLKDFGK